MGRKNVLNYTIYSSQSMAANFDNLLAPTNINFLDNVMILAQWTTGSSPLGVLKVFVSNDEADVNPQANRPPTNWYELDFGSPIVVNSSDNKAVINMTQLPATWLAIGYERTGGSGLFTAKMTIKQVGG